MKESPLTPSEDKIREAVNRSKTRAEEYLHDAKKSREFVEDAYRKANNKSATSTLQTNFWSQIKAFIRMLKAYINKEYTVVPWASIVLAGGAVLYFLTPIDLILDWLPLAGFIDDAAVLVFVMRQIRLDLEKFQAWELARVNPGRQIIDL